MSNTVYYSVSRQYFRSYLSVSGLFFQNTILHKIKSNLVVSSQIQPQNVSGVET